MNGNSHTNLSLVLPMFLLEDLAATRPTFITAYRQSGKGALEQPSECTYANIPAWEWIRQDWRVVLRSVVDR
jgi:hypothetical protein